MAAITSSATAINSILRPDIAEREVYGLPTDDATVQALFAGADVGTEKWGVPMTADEEALIDLGGRMEFADTADRDVLPALRRLSSFGGAWIDQQNGGRLVVQLTRPEDAAVAQARSRLPAGPRGLVVEFVDHSETELQAALETAGKAWDGLTSVRPLGIATDVRNNRLSLEVLAVDGIRARAAAASIERRVGVAIDVVSTATSRASDVACTDREHCSDPYKAGILIREGGTSGEPPCTLAFPIVVAGDVQAVTAGHCGHYGSAWFHKGEGQLGSVQSNQWKAEGRDMLRLSMFDSQASEKVYGFTTPSSWGPEQYNAINGYPIANETLCASLGRSSRNDCGVVTSTSKRYWSDTVGFFVFGAQMNGLTPQPIDGDSGSPIHRSYQYTGPATPHWRHTAVGVLATEFGEFAKINDSLAAWNATIWTG
ncbi:MAG: hypothetical protein H0U52_01225 [Chloroflexi bacterium]|nr:hypothetical protein [Chloroflexota bacterium]